MKSTLPPEPSFKTRPTPSRAAAFTRTELLLLVCVIGMLAAVQLTALDRTNTRTEQMVCMENLRRLGAGWLMYADDNGGKLVPNRDGANAGKTTSTPSWVAGWLDFTSNLDNAEVRFLVEPDYLWGGMLGPFVQRNHFLFRCPSDTSTVSLYGRRYPRVRSISMNGYLNAAHPWCMTGNWTVFRTLSDFRRVSPTSIFLMIDQHPDSINDGDLFVDMCNQLGQYTIVDYPAGYHDRGASLNFADGHAELWQWRDPRTTPTVTPGSPLTLNIASPGNQDIARLQAATTVRQ